MPKVYIIGAAGSGKSFYAKKLAKELDIPVFDLDDIEWETRNPTTKRNRDDRARMVDHLIQTHPDWIVEGIYVKDWINPFIETADEIIILKPHRFICAFRILKRWMKRRLKMEPCAHPDTFKTTWGLLKWNWGWENNWLPLFMAKISGKKYKIIK